MLQTPKIARLREKVGLTQRELSEYVGVTETTIANWEQGRSGLEWITRITRLCQVLGCTIEQLICITNEQSIAPKITELRERKRLTQKQLSEKIGVTETTIANWERGRSGLDWIERLIRVCKALNCNLEDLVESSATVEAPATKDKRLSLAELLNQSQSQQVKRGGN
jgi:transcriptional regulator with XRE-family HTH domain